MNDTPRVTVPVEPTLEMTMAGAGCLPSVDGVFGIAGALSANVYRAMLSVAPAPEGGAVDDEAFKIATDLHKAYEQLIYGLPKYLDAENLTDEENMIREAWITLDVTAHRLAALATRAEAPAEAGEPEALRMAYKTGYQEGVEDSDGNFCRDACEEGWGQYLEALRAQPQAREVAYQDAHDTAVELGYPSLTEALEDLDRLKQAREDAQPVACVSCEDRPASGNNPCASCGRTHPAPDALRVAVEAFMPSAEVAFLWAKEAPPADEVQRYRERYWAVKEALAALQAEVTK